MNIKYKNILNSNSPSLENIEILDRIFNGFFTPLIICIDSIKKEDPNFHWSFEEVISKIRRSLKDKNLENYFRLIFRYYGYKNLILDYLISDYTKSNSANSAEKLEKLKNIHETEKEIERMKENINNLNRIDFYNICIKIVYVIFNVNLELEDIMDQFYLKNLREIFSFSKSEFLKNKKLITQKAFDKFDEIIKLLFYKKAFEKDNNLEWYNFLSSFPLNLPVLLKQ